MAHPSCCTRAPRDGALDGSACWLRVHPINKPMIKKPTRSLGSACKRQFSRQPFSAEQSRDESCELSPAAGSTLDLPAGAHFAACPFGHVHAVKVRCRGQADVRMTDQSRERMAADGRSLPVRDRRRAIQGGPSARPKRTPISRPESRIKEVCRKQLRQFTATTARHLHSCKH